MEPPPYNKARHGIFEADVWPMLDRIMAAARELQPQLVELRRAIHRHPELAFAEHETGGLIASALEEAGIAAQRGVGKTGVVGLVRGPTRGGTFAIRVDIDALPIQEQTGLPFASENDGVMHACGHDGNTAIGLGAGLILQGMAAELPGAVKLIFQPAEEGAGGAEVMIADGVMDDPHVEAIIAAHVEPRVPLGHVSLMYGAKLAAADRVNITITGKGSHAAYPHESNDAIVAAAHAIIGLQSIASRQVDPLEPVVVTIGRIAGGSAFNIIPERVDLEGTVRTLSPAVQEKVHARIEEVVRAAAGIVGASQSVRIEKLCPALIHDDELTALAERTCRTLLGDAKVHIDTKPSMGSEDYAFFAERAPATHLSVGTTGPGTEALQQHTPHFTFDEECLSIGAAALAAIAAAWLRAHAA